MNDRYNGWTNYETWCWKLWIDNDQSWYESWQERATDILEHAASPRYYLADLLKSESEDMAEQWMNDQSGPFADILNAGLSQINWYEIAESILDTVQESESCAQ